MSEPVLVPPDFGARVRAGRNYIDLSRDDFGPRIGMSGGYVKDLENGKSIKPPELLGLVSILADVTGLPESFYLGQTEPELARIEAQLQANADAIQTLARDLQLSRAETAARAAEVLKRIDEAEQAIRQALPSQPRTGTA